MRALKYVHAIPRLKGRPRRNPDYKLGLTLTAEITIVQMLIAVWIMRALELPHNSVTYWNIVFWESIVGGLFLLSWVTFIQMLISELRPLVEFRIAQ
ncbi:hypothetical protein [Paraburkholderia acidiphila]|uniref:Uncharacterized protein n=1 Tax=Paraburkholderia acidiphila TaxID=2571747 RepID=A0A7Z2G4W0_9BURK|nr:hypothetical protein [Paraburkholderia acidiphila]QGZ55106.1 hypothetical protein FAZ97_09345 [Paraburkholderia acidiphila]